MVQMKTEYWYVILGAVGMVALAHYFPSLKKLDVGSLKGLDDVQGIDLNALTICRQKGLM